MGAGRVRCDTQMRTHEEGGMRVACREICGSMPVCAELCRCTHIQARPAYPGVSGCIWEYPGVSRRIWAYLGVFRHVQSHPGVSGRIWAYLGVSGRIWARTTRSSSE